MPLTVAHGAARSIGISSSSSTSYHPNRFSSTSKYQYPMPMDTTFRFSAQHVFIPKPRPYDTIIPSIVNNKKPLQLPFLSPLSITSLPLSLPLRAVSDDASIALTDSSLSSISPSPADLTLALKLLVQKKATDVAPELKGTSIFLVGMKSSIKMRLAKLLAEVFRYYYFDSDKLVEEAAGGEASAELLRESDEQGFRESETEVLRQLSSMGRLVVCAGDGAVQSSTNLAFLRHGISIWIDVPLEVVAAELAEDRDQGHDVASDLASSESIMELAAMYEENRGGYATADATISIQRIASKCGYDDFEAVTLEDVAMEVLKEIERLTRVKKMMEEAGRPF